MLTLFSSSNYYEVGSNKGAFAQLMGDLKPNIVQYIHVASNIDRRMTIKQRLAMWWSAVCTWRCVELFAWRCVVDSCAQLYVVCWRCVRAVVWYSYCVVMRWSCVVDECVVVCGGVCVRVVRFYCVVGFIGEYMTLY